MFWQWQTAPASVPTDTVVGLKFLDDSLINRNFVMNPLYIFDEVLDAEKLRGSLERLVERDGFRKLGARLRKNAQGSFEHHIPAKFGNDRPAVGFTYARHDVAAADHSAVALLLPEPRSKARPALVADPAALAKAFHGPDSPRSMDDYLYVDRPQLCVHVVLFSDRTVVSVYWPHSLFDAMGMKVMLDAWTLMLQGREDDIIPPYGFDREVLGELGRHATRPHALADKLMTTPQLVMYGLRNLADMTVRAKDNRMVYIPATFVEKLRARAAVDLAAEGQEKAWVSEGDVLAAWWLRLAIIHIPANSKRNVVIQNAFSMRAALEEDVFPPGRGYLSNCTGYINFMLSAQDILEKSLGHIATHFRRAITEQARREHVEAYAALVRASSSGAPPFFGDGSSHLVTFSNWNKARHFEFDLSAAKLATISDGSASSRRVVPSYVQCVEAPYSFAEGFQILGKDAGGNYWLGGNRVKGLWGRIEEELAKEDI